MQKLIRIELPMDAFTSIDWDTIVLIHIICLTSTALTDVAYGVSDSVAEVRLFNVLTIYHFSRTYMITCNGRMTNSTVLVFFLCCCIFSLTGKFSRFPQGLKNILRKTLELFTKFFNYSNGWADIRKCLKVLDIRKTLHLLVTPCWWWRMSAGTIYAEVACGYLWYYYNHKGNNSLLL